jgi:hypothetical protein
MRVVLVWMFAAGCSSPASPSPDRPTQPPLASVDAAPPPPAIDALVISDELANAPAWIFRYATKERSETWTLRHHNGSALVVVEGKTTTRYHGTATDGASLAIAVVAGASKLSLDCKKGKRGVGTACNDARAKPIDILDCYHPDFGSPMTFGAAPGIEYTDSCNGYRLIAK